MEKSDSLEHDQSLSIDLIESNQQVSDFINEGLWTEIYSFLSLRDILELRIICNKWQKKIRNYFGFKLIRNNNILESLKIKKEQIVDYLPKDQNELLATALKLKQDYDNNLIQVSKKHTPYTHLSSLAVFTNPPDEIILTMKAIIHLITPKSKLNLNKPISWIDCRQKLKDRRFIETLKSLTPDKLDNDCIIRFQTALDWAIPDYLKVEAPQLGYMLSWALGIISFKKIIDEMPDNLRNLLRELSKEPDIINENQKILKCITRFDGQSYSTQQLVRAQYENNIAHIINF